MRLRTFDQGRVPGRVHRTEDVDPDGPRGRSGVGRTDFRERPGVDEDSGGCEGLLPSDTE